jgi:2-succinyl-5-enolpyruvyl-6-hydroxy-3-cyclohexene-1-carboxylate synthase
MNPSTALATVIVDELIRCGVSEAVLAPGSRSAPLAFAFHEADRTGRLRLHVRIDERSAGFLALGLAKVSLAPVPVLVTSGTATANLHPAVLEASESGVPLVVLTADRPPELRSTGANQTVDQIDLYGRAVRWSVDVPAPEERGGQNAYWRSVVCRAVARARGARSRDPGPVHLNLAFREPLTPQPGGWQESIEGRAGRKPWTVIHSPPAPGPPAADGWPARVLVIVGDSSRSMGAAVVALAESRGWPVISEPTGHARHGPSALRHGAHLLGVPGFVESHRPERVLVVGRPTVHREVLALLSALGSAEGSGGPGGSDSADPSEGAVWVVGSEARFADAGRIAAHVLADVPEQGSHHAAVDPSWLPAWRAADDAATAAIRDVLDNLPPALRPAETDIADKLHSAIPSDALLLAGSSLPVRHLAGSAPRVGVTIIANRGAAGIDGTVSTAVGAALAWQRTGGGPAFALVGDLTFLHDANGLVVGAAEPVPDLTVVVLDNAGGRIFSLLEQGAPDHADAFERIFGTPHGVDIPALCAATGTPCVAVTSVAELAEALGKSRSGLSVVHVAVSPDGAAAIAPRVRRAVDDAVLALRG